MIVVVDTNIIFSFMLSHKTFLAEILLDKIIKFTVPDFLFVEIFKHRKEDLLKTPGNLMMSSMTCSI